MLEDYKIKVLVVNKDAGGHTMDKIEKYQSLIKEILEEGIATALLAAGVPKEDIVLAFHSPEKRKYTEFAIA